MNNAPVYATIVSIAIIVSILLVLLLIFNMNAFIIAFALYIIGVSIYSYVYFVKNPPKNDDINYNVNKYISIFNFSLSGFIIIMAIAFMSIMRSTSMRRY